MKTTSQNCHYANFLGAREGVPKLAIIMTDGHSQRPPRNLAHRLRAEGIELFAVSMTPSPYVDEAELLSIAQDARRVFTPLNDNVSTSITTSLKNHSKKTLALQQLENNIISYLNTI